MGAKLVINEDAIDIFFNPIKLDNLVYTKGVGMQFTDYPYFHDNARLQGFLAMDEGTQKKPAVIVAHDWSGCNEFAKNKAKMLADLGYIGFALDMFGEGRVGATTEEKTALIQPFMTDRLLLQARIKAAFETVLEIPQVDTRRIAAIGFCFGGLCVLDLARSGVGVKGVVSFHGLLNKAEKVPNHAIQSKVLVLHGYDDPMVPPAQVNTFSEEMTKAKVDWQVHQYGNTVHGFTNPQANDVQLGTLFNILAEKRSLQSMRNFLQEIFAE